MYKSAHNTNISPVRQGSRIIFQQIKSPIDILQSSVLLGISVHTGIFSEETVDITMYQPGVQLLAAHDSQIIPGAQCFSPSPIKPDI